MIKYNIIDKKRIVNSSSKDRNIRPNAKGWSQKGQKQDDRN